jgi:two-component system sensor histidine kinase KdpD
MTDQRPDPDQLLARLREREEREGRAKLKIFFGASAGVGKTFAMLIEAHERRRAGVDVVAGVIETHGRAETQALLDGLEILPPREIEYRGARLREFDLDTALARRPQLVLVDELAHTNAPGSRHAKRWQDIEELLGAGIDVYTTLNVQHVDSLNETVEQITGVRVRETVPDSVIDRADEIEMVDLPPDDLLVRLREGKVYVSELAGRAADHFFKKGNLIALRELALRTTADRVDAEMESYRRTHAIEETWPVGGRVLVCVGKASTALALVRAARRMAAGFKAEWVIAHVERPGERRDESERRALMDVMAFAEELGAETRILSGHRLSDAILAFARDRNVARIVIGKPTRPRWQERIFGSLVSALLRESQDIDVYAISGDVGPERSAAPGPLPAHRHGWRDYAWALGVVAVCTGVAELMHPRFDLSNLIMVYLVGVMGVAMRLGRAPASVAALLSVAAFDFFFVPPRFTFAVSDTQYLVTFAIMMLAAMLIATLTHRMRLQTEAARQREQRNYALYRVSQELAAAADRERLLESIVRLTRDLFGADVVVLIPHGADRVAVEAGDETLFGGGEHERGVAQWVFDNAGPAGIGTPTLPAARALYLPLMASQGAIGVLGVRPVDGAPSLDPDQRRLLDTFASQAALALERIQLAEQASASRVQAETERLRSSLLSSVSHDLRTPLAVITGAASALLGEPALPDSARREMAESIAEESARLNRLVGNLLDMTRLEANALDVKRDWHSLEEVIGAAVRRLGPIGDRTLRVQVAPGLPLVQLDDVLIEQVLFNLLDNAVKHTSATSPIEVVARSVGDAVEVEVRDRGPGLPAGEEELVFEKFYRLKRGDQPRGAGLGLAICRGIVEAHGGRIVALNRPEGGAIFRFTLPRGGEPPVLQRDEGERGSEAVSAAPPGPDASPAESLPAPSPAPSPPTRPIAATPREAR